MRLQSIMLLLILLCYINAISHETSASFTNINKIRSHSYEPELKTVFIGINNSLVDITVLENLVNSPVQGTYFSSCSIDLDNWDFGRLSDAQWDFTYHFANNSYEVALFDYISSIAINDTIEVLSKQETYQGYYIPALLVEDYLIQNPAVSAPENGYILYFLDFENLGPHWYNHTWIEQDTGSLLENHFMPGFGGHDRMFFLDLSVSTYHLEDANQNSPIQELKAKYNPSTDHDKIRICQYFNDWIRVLQSGIFHPNLLYSTPNSYQTLQFTIEDEDNIELLSPNSTIEIQVHMFNNITGITPEDLQDFINQTEIVNAFEEILPWYSWQVSIEYHSLQDFSFLADSTSLATEVTGNRSDGRPIGSIDLVSVYDYIVNEFFNLREDSSLPFLDFGSADLVIPSLCFAFDGDLLFGIPYKTSLTPNIWGISLFVPRGHVSLLSVYASWNPFILVNHNYDDLFNDTATNGPYGFTQTIIHEVGHSIGAAHPHSSGIVSDYTADVMSYLVYEYNFGSFVTDAVRRGEIDILLKWADLYYSEAINLLQGSKGPNFLSTEADMDLAIYITKVNYNLMDYIQAYPYAWIAFEEAKELYNLVKGGSDENNKDKGFPGFLWYEFLVVMGFSSFYLAYRKIRTK